MASGKGTRGGSGWTLGRIFSLRWWLLILTAQGSGGVIIPGAVQEMTGHGTFCYSLVTQWCSAKGWT